MLGCKIIDIKNLNEIEQKLNNWVLLNKEKKVLFITQSYVFVDVDGTTVDKRENLKNQILFISILYSLKVN
ncbi:MAG: hypothetical protein ACFE91_13355 [Promethearchaeota archaeon]